MELINIDVAPEEWTQVHDGATTVTIAIAGNDTAQICQVDAKPAAEIIGLPLVGGSATLRMYTVTSGAPVFVKALNNTVTIVINK